MTNKTRVDFLTEVNSGFSGILSAFAAQAKRANEQNHSADRAREASKLLVAGWQAGTVNAHAFELSAGVVCAGWQDADGGYKFSWSELSHSKTLKNQIASVAAEAAKALAGGDEEFKSIDRSLRAGLRHACFELVGQPPRVASDKPRKAQLLDDLATVCLAFVGGGTFTDVAAQYVDLRRKAAGGKKLSPQDAEAYSILKHCADRLDLAIVAFVRHYPDDERIK